MPKCAFLSIANTEGWFIDDDLVHAPLQSLGWEVKNIPWNEPTDWNIYDLVLIRSTWDYQNHLNQFIEVLNQIQQSDAVLLNSIELVNWNIDKNYLFELTSMGVELVPTIKTSSLCKENIELAFKEMGTDDLIVKPMIGANADDTFHISKTADTDFRKLESIFNNRECMIQPFMKNIVEEGEFSLMYFQGKLSHTILKTVAAGDYRVQEEHGGGVVPIKVPDVNLVSAGDKAMSALPETPFYARVDLVRTAQNSFALMELELIEPCLYFRFDDESPQNFANCIQASWNERKALIPVVY